MGMTAAQFAHQVLLKIAGYEPTPDEVAYEELRRAYIRERLGDAPAPYIPHPPTFWGKIVEMLTPSRERIYINPKYKRYQDRAKSIGAEYAHKNPYSGPKGRTV